MADEDEAFEQPQKLTAFQLPEEHPMLLPFVRNTFLDFAVEQDDPWEVGVNPRRQHTDSLLAKRRAEALSQQLALEAERFESGEPFDAIGTGLLPLGAGDSSSSSFVPRHLDLSSKLEQLSTQQQQQLGGPSHLDRELDAPSRLDFSPAHLGRGTGTRLLSSGLQGPPGGLSLDDEMWDPPPLHMLGGSLPAAATPAMPAMPPALSSSPQGNTGPGVGPGGPSAASLLNPEELAAIVSLTSQDPYFSADLGREAGDPGLYPMELARQYAAHGIGGGSTHPAAKQAADAHGVLPPPQQRGLPLAVPGQMSSNEAAQQQRPVPVPGPGPVNPPGGAAAEENKADHKTAVAPELLAAREVAANGGGLSGLTTVMLRHLPSKYHQHKLVREINAAGFVNKYDFLYLPMEESPSQYNRGFAFINFETPEGAEAFYRRYHGQRLYSYATEKTLAIMPADLQGFERNVEHYVSMAQQRRVQSKAMFFKPLPPHLLQACQDVSAAFEVALPENCGNAGRNRKGGKGEKGGGKSQPGPRPQGGRMEDGHGKNHSQQQPGWQQQHSNKKNEQQQLLQLDQHLRGQRSQQQQHQQPQQPLHQQGQQQGWQHQQQSHQRRSQNPAFSGLGGPGLHGGGPGGGLHQQLRGGYDDGGGPCGGPSGQSVRDLYGKSLGGFDHSFLGQDPRGDLGRDGGFSSPPPGWLGGLQQQGQPGHGQHRLGQPPNVQQSMDRSFLQNNFSDADDLDMQLGPPRIPQRSLGGQSQLPPGGGFDQAAFMGGGNMGLGVDPVPRFCRYCGKPTPPDFRFCSYCGMPAK
eukprot:TRINITY_DN23865_c0_g1_i1.p1 TRINITY_DN23865_c0_g1~~TRINITY_DN23865_c0_g1_i1.p1  ORF type:complete len:803 (-),score=178.62 TRINITY_DN23865_c0_g1_i1:258-2666(-)